MMVAPRRWAMLSSLAFHLDELPTPRREDVTLTLDTVLELFDAKLDPVEDFEGAAVRRLALSLQRALRQVSMEAVAR